MEEFNGLCRNTTRAKTPPSKWQNARNILLNKKRGSITQEDGFDYVNDVPGKVIGKIETNEHIVYFSIDGDYSVIGYKDRDNNYTTVIKSLYLGFNIRCPIEGIYYYDYKGNLIVIFCDGVLDYSNPPKLMNLFNLGVELTGSFELVNPDDIISFYLFPPITQGNIAISYTDNSTLNVDIAYVTFSYILDDGISSSPFYVVQDIAYPTYGFEEEKRRTIILNLTELDTRYNKIRIGLLVNTDEGLLGYQSSVINYTGTSVEVVINSLANYTSIAIDNLVVPSIIYNRVETITKQFNKVAIGKTVIEDTIPFQKYANMIELESHLIDEIDYGNEGWEDQYFTHPSLCPDEVYAFFIEPQLKDGTYIGSFHIPGRIASAGETDTLSNSDLTAMGLSDLISTDTYKRFRIVNSGGFVLPPPYLSADIGDRRLTFGYWENQETYPNDNNYNSTIDYEGNPLGGTDLRGTPIRFHRIAGLDAIANKVPSLLGATEKDKRSLTIDDGFYGKQPRIGIKVTNFISVVPEEIRNQLQGFRINIAKRTEGNRLVEDINFLKQNTIIRQNISGTTRGIMSPFYYKPATTDGGELGIVEQFGTSVVYSSTLEIYKPSISPLLIKANYAVDTSRVSTIPFHINFNYKGGFYKIPTTQKYAVIKDIEYIPGNNIAADSLFMEDKVLLTAKNNLQGDGGLSGASENRWNPLLIPTTGSMSLDKFDNTFRVYMSATLSDVDSPYELLVSSTLINLPKNVYSGFTFDDFICLGRLSLSNTTKELNRNGDIFFNNKIDYPIGLAFGTTINGLMRYYQFELKGMIAIPNNSRVYIEDNRELKEYAVSGGGDQSSLVNTFTFTPTIYNREVYRSLNDKISSISFDVNTPFINYFPFRVALSLSIANENLQTNNVRTFLANNYYEMPNDKGDIVALRGTNKEIYIQQRYTLHIASIRDKLTTQEGTTYLGESTLFDRIPNELFDEQGGYIGSTSKFACIVIKEGYVVVDQVKGNIFIIGQGIKEISKPDMDIWFKNNWNTSDTFYYIDRVGKKQKVDNPYNSVGHLVGKDNKYNRLLFTKKFFTVFGHYVDYDFDGEFYKDDEGNLIYYIDGAFIEENSITLSYSLEDDTWICDHDYYPNVYITQNEKLFSILTRTSSSVYKHNSLTQKPATYYNISFNNTFNSYVDLIFNSRPDLPKLYQTVLWNTTAISSTGNVLYRRTIDAIMIYNDNQCSGIISLTGKEFELYRDNEGIFNLNEFRDIATDNNVVLVRENGTINTANLNINRSWFEKSNFIGTFIIIRMQMNNTNTDKIYINNVNLKSRISQR